MFFSAEEGLRLEDLEIVKPNVVIEYFKGKLPNIADFGFKLIIALLIYFIGSRLIKFVRKLMKKSMERSTIEKGVVQFLDSLVKVSLYTILLLIIGSIFGLETTSVIAVAGSAGLALGLALQGSLANFAGGVLILILKLFRVGDYIIEDTHKNEGTVKEIQLFYTKLLTVDNKEVIIPNGVLANSSLTNVTGCDKRRCDIIVGISYESDLKEAKDLIRALLERDEDILKTEDSIVFVESLGESSVNIGCRYWTRTELYWTTRWRIIEEIKIIFDKNNIIIPYNQLDVTIKKEELKNCL